MPSFPPLSALKYKWKLSPVLCAALPLAIINFRSHFRVNEASVSCSSSGHIHFFQVLTRAAVTQWGTRWSSPATHEAFWHAKDVQDWRKWYYAEIVLPFKRNPTRMPTNTGLRQHLLQVLFQGLNGIYSQTVQIQMLNIAWMAYRASIHTDKGAGEVSKRLRHHIITFKRTVLLVPVDGLGISVLP